MLFNYDSIEIVAIVVIVVSSIVICKNTLHIITTPTSTPTQIDSLVNTNSSLNSLSKLNIDNLPNTQYSDSGVQTVNTQIDAGIQTANTYVNSGMQTSNRMWLESIRNWINEILGSTSNPHGNPQYKDVGVQTGTRSYWEIFKEFVNKFLNIETSSVTTPNNVRVDTWRSRLGYNQSVDLHDSESPLTQLRFDNDDDLESLIGPNDNSSQVRLNSGANLHMDPANINEVVSEANLKNVNVNISEVVSAARVYNMGNRKDLLDLMNDPYVTFSVDPVYEGEDLITFYTADSSHEILRSVLENLLTSVN